ncbi:MAG: gliding motility-associated C-terminal domain-containing protein [Bacteroidetes bacterium]|nr:gliding motility-associated C-terminal domain-containing protein [Bacteroidota bacterium]HET6245367.1 gliding motility-associated C-terminal domain-containing protein [Bacteroidia bacterium]
MKKIFTFFSALLLSNFLIAQNDAALAAPNGTFLAPVSGCSLTSTENVTVRIFNFGPGAITTGFDVSYSINGGPSVIETVSAPINIPANTSFTYTFLSQANLSIQGTYTLDASVILAGDPTPGNNTYSGYVVNSLEPSNGGTVSGPASVCISGNSGFLTLGGNNGNILRWEYSTDGGGTWVNISNTSTIQNYNNLTVPTMYRAVVQNGSCASANSLPLSIGIDPVTIPGNTAGATTVCSGTNSGNVTLSGNTGTITNWEFSIDGGISWSIIANTTATLSYLNITQTTRYRAVVKSGACSASNSSITIITVNPPTIGGNLSPLSTTVCSGANSGTLTLSGQSGSIIRWEVSTNSGSTWTNITNTTTTLNYLNLTQTSLYRVRIQSTGCPALYSDTATVTVNPPTVAGTLSAAATVCSGTNSGTLTLAGSSGSIIRWEFSINGGGSWTNIANTTNTQNYTNLITTTRYRVRVQNGICTALNSNAIDITVNPLSVGGTISGTTTVCGNTNSGTLTLSGNTGSVQRWESSINNGTTWDIIVNTTTTQNYSNLPTTTWYRANLMNGVCAAAYSDTAIITFAPATDPGILSADATVCSGTNTGTLTLSGYSGTIIRWEFSINGGGSWSNIANTTDSHVYNNLTTTTSFRALVQNGSCPVLYSNFIVISVNPVTIGGTVSGATTVCSGNNSGTLSLSGHTGTIIEWEFSIDAGTIWSSIANTSNSQAFVNLTTTTIYRAVIQSGVCLAERSTEETITVDPITDGGSVSGATTVCSGANSGNVSLVGNIGNVLNWEFSTDNGNSWINISNNTTTQNYNNITTPTMYRVLVQSGLCSSAYSSTALVNVNQPSAGGTIYGATTVCSGSNNGTLSLIGISGNIIGWEESTDNGVSWVAIANTTSTHNYNNLLIPTHFRAIVQSGICSPEFSSIAIINVDVNSVGGLVSGNATVCAGSNNGTVTLSGETGNVIGWEFSTDGGISWILLSNTTSSQDYFNISVTTMYRALVKNGVCNAVNSMEATITVDPATNAGILTGNTFACSNNNNGTIILSNYVGDILDWEESNNGLTWFPTGNTADSYTYNNLFITTYFRVLVQSGSCAVNYSSTVIVTVDAASVGGTVSGSTVVCAGTNNGTVTLSGETGNIVSWEFSNDGGNSWISLSNTSSSQNYSNLTITTSYRALVKNGVCGSVTSSEATITVDQLSNAGVLSSNAVVCSNSNSGTITLSGYVGEIIDWLESNSGISWFPSGNTSNTQNYNNLLITTYYKAIVMNGLCEADTSNAVIITVNPVSVGGNLTGSNTVCPGDNNGTLYLAGQTGNIVGWEISNDNGNNWMPISNQTDSLVYNNIIQTTLYRVMVKSGICNAVYSNTVVISVSPKSIAGNISGITAICAQEEGSLTLNGYTGSIIDWESSIDGGLTWSSLGNTLPSYTYSLQSSARFRVIVISGSCPADTSLVAQVNVFAKPEASFIAEDVCFGNSVSFQNTSTITSGSIQLNMWDFGNGLATITRNPSHDYLAYGEYVVLLKTISNNNCIDTVSATVRVFELPSAKITNSATNEFCMGSNVELSVDNVIGLTYQWSNGSMLSSTTIDSSGTYSVTVTNVNNSCSSKDSIKITAHTLPIAFAGNDTSVAPGRSIKLQATGGLTYLWTPSSSLDFPGSADPIASPISTTIYTVKVTDIRGCSSVDSLMIEVKGKADFMVFNLITPNGDGFNDTWFIEKIELFPENEVVVFNRNGQTVFSANSYDNSWNGTYNGTALPDGTYYYILKFTNTRDIQKGSVNILRNQK